mgnify:CR=1 FL=1
MNKLQLQSEIKSSGTAWIMYLFLGCHYAYLGKWGVQLAYWFTLGGLGLWMFIDMFRLGGLVKKHNNNIYQKIEDIEEEKHRKTLEMLAASR